MALPTPSHNHDSLSRFRHLFSRCQLNFSGLKVYVLFEILLIFLDVCKHMIKNVFFVYENRFDFRFLSVASSVKVQINVFIEKFTLRFCFWTVEKMMFYSVFCVVCWFLNFLVSKSFTIFGFVLVFLFPDLAISKLCWQQVNSF